MADLAADENSSVSKTKMLDTDESAQSNIKISMDLIAEILQNNLEVNYSKAVLQSNAPSASNSFSTTEIGKPKFTIVETDIKSGDYFGDQRLATLTEVLSVKIKFLVELDSEEKYQYWIIKIPISTSPVRQMANLLQVDTREISFYTEVLKDIKTWINEQFLERGNVIELQIPHCFYGKNNRPYDKVPLPISDFDSVLNAESVLILEDLRTREFGKRHFGFGMTVGEVMTVIDEIAKFHAVTWAMQETSRDKLQWSSLYGQTDCALLHGLLVKTNFDELIELLQNAIPDDPETAEIVEKVKDFMPKTQKVLTDTLALSDLPSPTCLIHLVLWSENILFRTKEDDRYEADLECYIIDWQMTSLGRPTHDLALLLLSSMDPDVRRENTSLLIKYYYQVFQNTADLFGLKLPFDLALIEKEFNKSSLLATLLTISSINVIGLERATSTRLFEAFRDLVHMNLI